MVHIEATGPDGSKYKLKVVARFSCPFCSHKKEFKIAYLNGDADTGIPSVLHDEVPCITFLTLGVIEYLRAARLAGAFPVEEPN